MYLTPPEPEDEALLPLLLSADRIGVPITCTKSDWQGWLIEGSWCAASLNGPAIGFAGPLGTLQVHKLVMHSPGIMGYLPNVVPEPHGRPSPHMRWVHIQGFSLLSLGFGPSI